jgi:hypothetical protein
MKKIICIYFLLSHLNIYSQEYAFPLNHDAEQRINYWINSDTTGFHSSIKPYVLTEVKNICPVDSVFAPIVRDNKFNSTWLGRKLLKEHLLFVDKDDIVLSVDPVFNLRAGRDFDSERNTFVNTRGVLVQGNVQNKFFFYSGFHENQARYISYVDAYVRKNLVVPGQGRVKFFENEIFDFSQAYGGIAYTLNRHFDFLLAHDKNFIGDGYRSLLLSDNAYNYPFLRINMTFWKFRYTVIYAVMQDLKTAHDPDVGYFKKYSTIHHLDLNIGKKNKFTVGIFETVLWKPAASRGYELGYLNPILFLRPVENSFDSPDNELLGLNVRWKINSQHTIYGQLMLDEFLMDEVKAGNGWWGNKQAFQLGYKSAGLFDLKNLNVQTEFNFVRPYTYQHRSEAQNYAHFNQALAHPLGANFIESVSFINYRLKNWFGEIKVQYAKMGSDIGGLNYGNDIFKSYETRTTEYGHYMFDGLEGELKRYEFRVNYLVNPKTNFVIELGVAERTFTNIFIRQQTPEVWFSLRTSLENYYFDF